MSLLEQIDVDLKDAMKARQEARLSTLRLLRSALKNKQIDVQHDLSDEEVLSVVKSQVKQLQDSFSSFESGGREDLAEQAKAELAVLANYLPEQMSDDDLDALVAKTLAEIGAASQADMGKAMGAVMKAVAGRADGGRAKAVVGRKLGIGG